ncbi:MAG: TetR/AcrR family transcriptional regulator [Peptococcaceae bacterium]|nr:TetR/AcrR family transcriptional regulator [Peptococcaceae bacterium]
MAERVISYFYGDQQTKNKILDVATRLFALNGYSAVSMRDISEAVGIRPGSLYNYYSGKEALMEEVLQRFELEYKDYFNWLIKENAEAETLDEVMHNMFVELLHVRELSTYYGISLIMREQFNYHTVRDRLFKLIYEDSINWMKADFDRLMDRGVIPRSDSKIIASILMFSVLSGNEMRIHESNGTALPLDCTEMYIRLKRFLSEALRRGI